MTNLIYQPNGQVKINKDYQQPFKVFAEHCIKLEIENPIVEGEYFKYSPSIGLTLIDRVGNELFIDDKVRDDLEVIIANATNFSSLLLPLIISKDTLLKQLPVIRRNYEDSLININYMDFLGDDTTRASLSEAISFLEELGVDAPEFISWSAESGFFDLSLVDLKTVALQIGARRQRAFVAQKLTKDEIDNENITTFEEVQTYFTDVIVSL